MNYRPLGRTGWNISELSLGTWQVGGKWGAPFDADKADRILHAAMDAGVNFIDTADVYSDGQSERAVGKAVRARSEWIYVATKCGRKLSPHTADGYTPENLQRFVEESLQRLGLEVIDLIQLHCPPTEVYYRPEVFGSFERLKEQGKIQHLGVSVEKVEEGLKAMAYDNVQSVQIIFNAFRQRPAELFFEQAKTKRVGVIARVPLASGLLTGKFDRQTTFGPDDHRQFNREGEAFDKGETFSGIDYERGLQAVDALREIFPGEENLAPRALQWILDHEAVSTVIPGASKVEQVTSNLSIYEGDGLSAAQRQRMDDVYAKYVKPSVHQRW